MDSEEFDEEISNPIDSGKELLAACSRGGQLQQDVKVNSKPLKRGPREHFISIFAKNDRDSVWFRSSPRFKRALEDMPSYIKTWSLEALEKSLGDKLTVKDRQLRISFWRDYFTAIDEDRMMSVSSITRGVCRHKYVYDVFLPNTKKMAWLLSPPDDYNIAMQEMLNTSMNEIRKIITAPIYDSKGKPLSSVMMAKLKAHEMIENRVKGIAPKTFNINQKSLSVNVQKGIRSGRVPEFPDGKPMLDVESLSVPELELELARLESGMKSLPQSVDVTEVDEEVVSTWRSGKEQLRGES